MPSAFTAPLVTLVTVPRSTLSALTISSPSLSMGSVDSPDKSGGSAVDIACVGLAVGKLAAPCGDKTRRKLESWLGPFVRPLQELEPYLKYNNPVN